MSTRNDAIKVAKEFGAEITKPNYSSYDHSYTVEAEAPDGKQWMTSGSVILVAVWYSYIDNSKEEAYADLIERMRFGLEDIDEP